MTQELNTSKAALCAAIDAAILLADELGDMLVAAYLEQAREVANCVGEAA